jgi:hypothetical protein
MLNRKINRLLHNFSEHWNVWPGNFYIGKELAISKICLEVSSFRHVQLVRGAKLADKPKIKILSLRLPKSH